MSFIHIVGLTVTATTTETIMPPLSSAIMSARDIFKIMTIVTDLSHSPLRKIVITMRTTIDDPISAAWCYVYRTKVATAVTATEDTRGYLPIPARLGNRASKGTNHDRSAQKTHKPFHKVTYFLKLIINVGIYGSGTS